MSFPSTPERDACYRWLLAACRGWLLARGGGQDVGQPVAPPSSLDWATLQAMAHYQGLEPLLHVLVSQRPPLAAAIPGDLRGTWERAYYGTRIRNSELLALLSDLAQKCDAIGVPLIVLKGPSLVAEVYGDVALRPMVDLDVLCHEGDLLAVRDVVVSLGFATAGPPYLYEVDFHSGERDVLLELHFDVHDLVRRRASFLESAWHDRTTTSIEDWSLPVLSPEHQVVYELGHAAWHRFDLDLRHLVDFAGQLLLRAAARDRATVARLLDAAGLTEEYALLAGALARMLDLPLESAPGAAVTPERRASFEQALLERSRAIGFVREKRTGAEFLRQRGLARKAAFAWRRLVPPRAAMQAAYNLRTPFQSLFCIPVHLARTLSDLYSRARAGF